MGSYSLPALRIQRYGKYKIYTDQLALLAQVQKLNRRPLVLPLPQVVEGRPGFHLKTFRFFL